MPWITSRPPRLCVYKLSSCSPGPPPPGPLFLRLLFPPSPKRFSSLSRLCFLFRRYIIRVFEEHGFLKLCETRSKVPGTRFSGLSPGPPPRRPLFLRLLCPPSPKLFSSFSDLYFLFRRQMLLIEEHRFLNLCEPRSKVPGTRFSGPLG